MVVHPTFKNVDIIGVINIPKLPTNKHLSIHTMKVKYKDMKKVKQVRVFKKNKSIFEAWKEDSR